MVIGETPVRPAVRVCPSRGPVVDLPLKATLHPSINAIAREIWEGMLPGDPESYDFYRAVEPIPPPGFRLGAISVTEADRTVAVAPIFQVNYRLDTPLQGRLRRITDWLHAKFPGLLALSVIGIGSPMSDNCAVGFAPELQHTERARVFGAMLDRLKEEANVRRISLLTVKGLGTNDLAECLTGHGYLQATTVPLAMLRPRSTSFQAWLDSLPKKRRIYFRNKLKATANLRIEYRTSIKGLEEQIAALYESTLAQSKVDYAGFDRLDPGYFGKVVDDLGERMQMMLCWKGEELVSFHLCLIGPDCIVSKQLGMRYPAAREHNLFFINGLMLVRDAIEKRIERIELGATSFASKLLFGSYLERRWLHFRCRWAMATVVLSPFVWLSDFERNDPELRKLHITVREQGEEATPSDEPAVTLPAHLQHSQNPDKVCSTRKAPASSQSRPS